MMEKRRASGTARAALLPIGRELLTGRVLDTNSQYLARRLFEIGILVQRTCSMDDEIDAITREIRRCKTDRVSAIITCGGLGPTPDDMTLKAVAAALRRDYVLDPEARAQIERRYRELHLAGRLSDPQMTPDRLKMAFMPKGARLMPNTVGTAPGADILWGRTRVFCLPGVPAEMKAMAEDSVFPALEGLSKVVIRRLTLQVGTGDESHLAAMIRGIQPAHPAVHMKPEPKCFSDRRVMYIHLETEGKPKEVDCRLTACVADMKRAGFDLKGVS
ncbi:MAG: competence/damage-inducible protein A [Deltaproteobacteria bacterium]|nr:competence/damage-inducible protein A [Deltaproteobacteria bacterium]